MGGQTLERWLLVNYAGYPFAPNSLMSDNGLANLAGALAARGRAVEILDYCTVETLRRFTSPALTRRLVRAWDNVRGGTGRGVGAAWRKLNALVRLQACERARQRLQEQALAALGQELVAQVREHGITAVGFKLWNGDGLEGAVQLAGVIRRVCPGVRVFGGGPMVDFFMEGLLGPAAPFDALVYGEGEETIQQLAEMGAVATSFGEIPNLLYRKDGRVLRTGERIIEDLDGLPLPLYAPEVYPALRGDDKIKIVVVDESRGCANQCAFCVHPMKSHRRLRLKSIPRLMQEIEQLDRAFGYRTFRFAGSCTPYGLLNAFAAEAVRRQRPLVYASFAHLRNTGEADFGLLRQSGCVALFFGIESGCQRLLDRMRKGVRADTVAETFRRANAAGIFTVGSLIYPAPGEDAASRQETLDLIAAAHPGSVALQPPVVAPRTDWFDHAADYGIAFRDRDAYVQALMRWKAKLLLPTALWRPLAVTVDGKPYKRVLKETAEFGRQLSALGVLTSVSDDAYLMSVRAGTEIRAFRDDTLRAFFTGDVDAISQVVVRINTRE